MDGHEGHGERHHQAADDQSCSSGKVYGSRRLLNILNIRRLPDKNDLQSGFFTIPADP
jgi:hypothetical protein